MSKSVQHVAFFHEYLRLGGAEMVTLNTIRYLKSVGVLSTVFTYTWNKEEWGNFDQDQSCTVLVLPREKNSPSINDNISFLTQEVKARKIDMLFFIDWMDRRYAESVREQTNCRIVIWLHSQPFWEIKKTYIQEKISASKNLKDFLRFYGYSYWRNYLGGRFFAGMKEGYRELISYIDNMIVLCPEYKEELVNILNLPLDQRDKILVLVNAIKLNPVPNLNKKKEIAYLGRLSRVDKQVHKLLRVWSVAYSRLPDWSLHIYGSGSDEKRLKKIVEQKHLDRVTFHGYKRNTQEVYDRTSIVCLTSFFEGWPMVLIEAQNNGCIPVSFNNGFGVQSIIGKDSKNGILVPQDDVLAFSNALLRLCSSQELRTELQNNVLKKRLDYVPSVNEETWNKILGKSTDREEL